MGAETRRNKAMKKSKKAKKPGLNLEAIEAIDPELAKEIREIRAKEAAGLIQYTKRTYRECRTWKEAWLYIFHRAWRASNNCLKRDGEKITCAVWSGPEFKDKLIDALEKIAARIGVNNDLTELRLIETPVTSKGIERLKKILPKATIKLFTREEAKKDKRIQYVNTDVEWIKKLYAESGG
jgi:hypothetical protein